MRNFNLVPVIHKCEAMVSWNWLDESTAGVSAGNTREVSASSGNVATGTGRYWYNHLGCASLPCCTSSFALTVCS